MLDGISNSIISSNSERLLGEVSPAPDKSISHRALMIASVAEGESNIHNLLEGEDVLQTYYALTSMGVRIERLEDKTWKVYGNGIGSLLPPRDVLDMGNAGTGARLLIGMVSSYPFVSVFTGDGSLRKRPMERVITPLERSGAVFMASEGDCLPLSVRGATVPIPFDYIMPVDSAQVKSSILLAGLNIRGVTTVVERNVTRDHTEKMLQGFGATVSSSSADDGCGTKISVHGMSGMQGKNFSIPGDFSSASFLIAAALICRDSDILITDVGVNPTRIGLYTTLIEMGANLSMENLKYVAGEPMADIRVRYSPDMRGVIVPSSRAALMIDEYPILSVVAAFSQGDTVMHGVGELRSKESDRIATISNGLRACGVPVTEQEDIMTVHGGDNCGVQGGVTISSAMDHRVAMSFLCLGLGAHKEVEVTETEVINTSYPCFISDIVQLGGNLIAKRGSV